MCRRPAAPVVADADDAAGLIVRITLNPRSALERRGDRANPDTDRTFDALRIRGRRQRCAGQTGCNGYDVVEHRKYLFRRMRDAELLLQNDGRDEIRNRSDRTGRVRRRWFACRGRDAFAAVRVVMHASTRADGTQDLPSSIRFGRDIAGAPCFDHGLDRPHDTDIAGAPAQIAAQSDANQALVGLREAQHQIARGDQHSRRAIAALQRVFAGEGRTKLCRNAVLIEAFDRGDFCPFASHRIGDARTRRHAVEQHRASTADAMFAAEVRTGQVELLANEVRKIGARFR